MSAEDAPTHVAADAALRAAPAADTPCAICVVDVPGVAALWKADAAACRCVLARHRALLRAGLAAGGGYEMAVAGDAMVCAFSSRRNALLWCLAALQQAASEQWPAVATAALQIDEPPVEEPAERPSRRRQRPDKESAGSAAPQVRGLPIRAGMAWGGVSRTVELCGGRVLLHGKPVWRALQCIDACLPGELVCDEDPTHWEGWTGAGAVADLRQTDSLKDGTAGAAAAVVPAQFAGRLSLHRVQALLARGSYPPVDPWWLWQGSQRPWSRPAASAKRRAGGGAVPARVRRVSEALSEVLMAANDGLLHRTPPQGRVTLVFTDVQGATELWDDDAKLAHASLSAHNRILRKLLMLHQGYEVKTEGNAFMLAFHEPVCALRWCVAAQLALHGYERWPTGVLKRPEAKEVYQYDAEQRNYVVCFRGLRVRMGVTTGEPDCEPDPVTGRMDYFGPVVNLAARISGQSRGGEIVAGMGAFSALERCGALPSPDVDAEPLGARSLKGITRSEIMFSLVPQQLVLRRAAWQQQEEEAKERRLREARERGERPDSGEDSASSRRSSGRWIRLVASAGGKKGNAVIGRTRLERILCLNDRMPAALRTFARTERVAEACERQEMRTHDTAGVSLPPYGRVTLAFTDIQGSTMLWARAPYTMKRCLNQHNRLLRGKMKECDGYEVKTEGDAFMVAFHNTVDALRWCLESQRALLAADWPRQILQQPDAREEHAAPTEDYGRDDPEVAAASRDPPLLFRGPRVRMGFNTGEPDCERDPVTGRMDYFGPMVNLTARVSGVGRGGQVVVGFTAFTELTRADEAAQGTILSALKIVPLGDVRLKGISQPESLHSVLPRSLAGRHDVWHGREETQKPRLKATNTFWTRNAHHLSEKHQLVQKAEQLQVQRSKLLSQLSEMQIELLRRLYALEDTLQAPERLTRVSVLKGVKEEMRSALRFSALLFKRLMPSDGRYGGNPMVPFRDDRLADLVNELNDVYQELCDDDPLEAARVEVGPWFNAMLQPSTTVAWFKRNSEAAATARRGTVRQEERPVKEPRSAETRRLRMGESGFNDRDARRLFQDFKLIDEDGSGEIHLKEILGRGQALAVGGSTFDMHLFKKIDKDRNGTISFLEILRAYFPDERIGDLTRWIEEERGRQPAEPKGVSFVGQRGRRQSVAPERRQGERRQSSAERRQGERRQSSAERRRSTGFALDSRRTTSTLPGTAPTRPRRDTLSADRRGSTRRGSSAPRRMSAFGARRVSVESSPGVPPAAQSPATPALPRVRRRSSAAPSRRRSTQAATPPSATIRGQAVPPPPPFGLPDSPPEVTATVADTPPTEFADGWAV
eukprot:TRINITY_DN7473_c3_g1_i1.p1 TRINITY_DN7473_c3_g1~~TRINITY_DN7473_c3_g1_i1.p1  ORF type:complete len:1548 (+),score=654.59 TRINITY_DN7473_c3_g1_i1:651-4646(+)